MIHIPILAVNTDKEIWGEDATEFKCVMKYKGALEAGTLTHFFSRPERWEKVPNAASAIPGVWANILTFFAGPHNCIGFRFSLAESAEFIHLFIILSHSFRIG
jgi:cytochrome P450